MILEATQISQEWAQIPSMRCDYLRVMADVLGLSPLDAAPLLESTSLTAESFAEADTLVSANDHIRVFANALRISQSPGLGVLCGRRLTAVSHGAMGFVVTHSATLADAIQALVTFIPTRVNFVSLSIHGNPETMTIEVTYKLPLAANTERLLTDILFGAFYELASQIVGSNLTQIVAQVTHPKPEDAQIYARHIPFTYQFSQDTNRVIVPRDLCLKPNAQADSQAYLIARQHCESLLQTLEAQTQGRMEQRIVQMMLTGQPGMLSAEMAADALFMTQRTLARRLRDEGTSFRKIRDKVLSQQAAAMLSDQRISVEAVAAQLNFHDTASFRRAFKRWNGLSPSAFRKGSRPMTRASNK